MFPVPSTDILNSIISLLNDITSDKRNAAKNIGNGRSYPIFADETNVTAIRTGQHR